MTTTTAASVTLGTSGATLDDVLALSLIHI